jgi:hypothetical protein
MSTTNSDLDSSLDAATETTLLEWYAATARDLPWRHTRDPYAILVSEVILQQESRTGVPLQTGETAGIASYLSVLSGQEKPRVDTLVFARQRCGGRRRSEQGSLTLPGTGLP